MTPHQHCMDSAHSQKRRGNYDEATYACKRAMDLAPEATDSYALLAQIEEERGNLENAVRLGRKVIDLRPGWAAAHHNLGRLLLQSGQFQHAIHSCRQALSLDPQMGIAYMHLGAALLSESQPKEAIEAFGKAIDLEYEHPEVFFHLGVAHCRQAEQHIESGNLEEAAESYKNAMDTDPDNAEAYFGLGHVLVKQNRIEEAIHTLRTAMSLDPGFHSKEIPLRSLLEAEASSGQVLERIPGGALRDRLQEMLQMDLASSLADEAREKLEKAAEVTHAIARKNPQNPDPLLLLGRIQLSLFQPDDARLTYERILGIVPDHLIALYSSAVMFHQAGLMHRAADIFLKLTERAEEFIPHHKRVLGDIYNKLQLEMGYLGRLHEMVPLLDKALLDHPDLEIADHTADFLIRQQESVDLGYPTVFLNTMAKSGSVYLKNRIEKVYNLPFTRISTGMRMVKEYVIPSWSKMAARGGCLVVQHINAGESNLRILREAGLKRILVHMRDPRQAMLSLLHHFTLGYRELDLHWQKLNMPIYTPEFDIWSFETQLDWCIQNCYPGYVQWVRDWVDVADRADQLGLEIKLVTYESFHNDEEKYFEMILPFLGLDVAKFFSTENQSKKDLRHHFRKGKIDEWRAVCSSDQIEFMNDMLPDFLLKRFDWNESFSR